MTLQTTISRSQPYGVIGDIVIDGPRRGHPSILLSNSERIM